MSEEELTAIRRIRRQYVANIAAVHVLRTMCGPIGKRNPAPPAPRSVEIVRDLLESDARLPAISRLDMLTYLALATDANPEDLKAARRIAAQFGKESSLPLDAATAQAINAWLEADMKPVETAR